MKVLFKIVFVYFLVLIVLLMNRFRPTQWILEQTLLKGI